ncbi:MAG: hypothetical protein IRY86_09685 [Thermorudis peleae]|nr:hypothetical protein [Thermorudis peleae]
MIWAAVGLAALLLVARVGDALDVPPHAAQLIIRRRVSGRLLSIQASSSVSMPTHGAPLILLYHLMVTGLGQASTMFNNGGQLR